MNELWQEISEEYKQARNALWCRMGAGTWSRDEDEGLYHLWNAYHKAKGAAKKEDLIYARILATMVTETYAYKSKYEVYNKFVKPSLEAYKRAKKAGLHPSKKELDLITTMAESLDYEIKCEETPYADMIKHIKGYEKFGTFQFHDSKPLHFEHNEDTAWLTLQFDVILKLRFDGIFTIETHYRWSDDYIFDFYCYPCFHNQGALTFDIGLYKITCSSISVDSITSL